MRLTGWFKWFDYTQPLSAERLFFETVGERDRLRRQLEHEVARREEAERHLLRLRWEVNFICGSMGLAEQTEEENIHAESDGPRGTEGQAV